MTLPAAALRLRLHVVHATRVLVWRGSVCLFAFWFFLLRPVPPPSLRRSVVVVGTVATATCVSSCVCCVVLCCCVLASQTELGISLRLTVRVKTASVCTSATARSCRTSASTTTTRAPRSRWMRRAICSVTASMCPSSTATPCRGARCRCRRPVATSQATARALCRRHGLLALAQRHGQPAVCP